MPSSREDRSTPHILAIVGVGALITAGLVYVAFDSGHMPGVWITTGIWIVVCIVSAWWYSRRRGRRCRAE
ncbi:hypothetical protein [Microbacterium radiodurans]|uniref:DUF2530 domain-containing protein n=1 Tax=Microbacterium radiodurans TaxID=661398 RepID=A0A5J5IP14_9MICO|nr:hypothetical protein [Microbacterium radiodurans]KAA9084135.1 hypothetical protein F6B42_14235 [Microbacterium radiodurans]